MVNRYPVAALSAGFVLPKKYREALLPAAAARHAEPQGCPALHRLSALLIMQSARRLRATLRLGFARPSPGRPSANQQSSRKAEARKEITL